MEHTTQDPKNPAKGRTGDEQQRIGHDDVFDVLSNQRRRHVIEELDRDPDLTLSALAEQLAAIEEDCAPDRVTTDERKRVYISLYQTHLPALDEAGVLDFEGREIAPREDVVAAHARIIDFARGADVERDEESGIIDTVLGGLTR